MKSGTLGDIGKIEVTDTLKICYFKKPVWGNIDDHIIRKEFRETTYFKCEELKVMMTHIGGYPHSVRKRNKRNH